MYLLPIQVPIYVDGQRCFVTTEWWRALELLRDSLRSRFGPILVCAPSLPARAVTADQALVQQPPDCGIELRPGFDLRCRARDFWLHERSRWQQQLRALIDRAELVHAGLDDLYRPIGFEGFRMGLQLGKPTLFVQDTDIVVQQRQLSAHEGPVRRARARAYAWSYQKVCRWSVARADLSLLKGSALMARYGPYARNAREFHDTSFSRADILDCERLQRRLESLSARRALRLVYCGRLVERKGVEASLRILARALQLGAAAQFDVMGDGAERVALERLAASLGIAQQVRFLGAQPYDAALLGRLATYDALLFTPRAEDTPRMIFDGYAAGLPLLGFDIPYVQERQRQEQTAVLLPSGQIEGSALRLLELCRQPWQLIEPSRNARKAAEYHCAEAWYARRAEWTFAAIEARKPPAAQLAAQSL